MFDCRWGSQGGEVRPIWEDGVAGRLDTKLDTEEVEEDVEARLECLVESLTRGR